MPQGMGEEPQQPEPAEQPDLQEQASEMASGQTSGQTELTDGSGNTNDGKQPSKEEKEAMRDFNNMQNIQVSNTGSTSGTSNASAVAGDNETTVAGANESAPDLYYYHTDHLGSTSIITDHNGKVAQYLAYTPYGETSIEERYVTPYKFNDSARREQNQVMLGLCRAEACLRAKHNGKELDAETGLYYYGARYYDPSAALWLGVDPLAEKYPGVSPYVYCAGNPVKLIDPDGQNQRQRKPQGCL